MKKLLLFIAVIGLTVSCVRVSLVEDCYDGDEICDYDPILDLYFNCEIEQICYY